MLNVVWMFSSNISIDIPRFIALWMLKSPAHVAVTLSMNKLHVLKALNFQFFHFFLFQCKTQNDIENIEKSCFISSWTYCQWKECDWFY